MNLANPDPTPCALPGPAEQDHATALNERLGRPPGGQAEGHRDIIRRFPHRNGMLAREIGAEEARFLAGGGFAG